jgi:hypothetical protein
VRCREERWSWRVLKPLGDRELGVKSHWLKFVHFVATTA